MSLGALIEALGSGVVAIAAAPCGLDAEVRGVAIHDPVDGLVDTGDLVLGVGVDPAAPGSRELVAALSCAGAVGLVVKGDASPLLDVARGAGLALFSVPREMAWSQLHTLLRSARAAEDGASSDAQVGDLFALANAIASMVGGPTTIEDLHSTVLAYSSPHEPIDEPRRQTILGRRIPDEWITRLQEDGVFRRIYSSADPIVVDYHDTIPGFATRLVAAVRAGDELLGTIWVAEADRPLGVEAVDALREAARLAALHLLRSRAADDIERRRRSDLLRAALDGRVAPEALGTSIGVAPTTSLTVVSIELLLSDEADSAAAAVAAERTVSLVTLHCEAYRRSAAAVATGRVVHVVLADPGVPDRAALVRFVHDLVGRTGEALRLPLRAAAGRTVGGVGDLLTSHREATAVLRAMQASSAPRTVATIDDVRSQVVLHALQDVATRDSTLREGRVAILADHDRDRKTAYVETLRAYLDHFGDVPAAAASVHVHPNTFRYRLRRLVEVSGLDLGDPVERLVVQLQLTLVD